MSDQDMLRWLHGGTTPSFIPPPASAYRYTVCPGCGCAYQTLRGEKVPPCPECRPATSQETDA